MPSFPSLRVKGTLQPRRVALPDASIRSEHWNLLEPLKCNKKINTMRLCYCEKSNVVTSSKQRTFYQANNAGKVVNLRVAFADGVNAANDITVDLLKNGVSILDTPVGTANALDYEVFPAVFTAAAAFIAYIEGDVFELVITKTTGTDKGLTVVMTVEEE